MLLSFHRSNLSLITVTITRLLLRIETGKEWGEVCFPVNNFLFKVAHKGTIRLQSHDIKNYFSVLHIAKWSQDTKMSWKSLYKALYPAGIYFFKVNSGNTRIMCEICSSYQLRVRHPWHHSGVFVVNIKSLSIHKSARMIQEQ